MNFSQFCLLFAIVFVQCFNSFTARQIAYSSCQNGPSSEIIEFKRVDITCKNAMAQSCVLNIGSTAKLTITIVPKVDIKNLTITGSAEGVDFFNNSPCSDSTKYCKLTKSTETKWEKDWEIVNDYPPIEADVEFKFFDASNAKHDKEYSCFSTKIDLQKQ